MNSLPLPSRVDFVLTDADGLPTDCPAHGVLSGPRPKLDLLSVVSTLMEGILMCGANRRVIHVNPSVVRLLGLPADALVGCLLSAVVTSAVSEFNVSIHEADWLDQSVIAEDRSQPNQIFGIHCMDGRTVWVSSSRTPLFTDGNYSMTASAHTSEASVTSYLVPVSLVNTTQIHEVQQRIRYLTTHDTLTDLSNRSALENRPGHALALVHRNQSCVSVMLPDLNRFKNINGTLSHQFGDMLLHEVVAHLQVCVRKADTVAHLSGDEFAVMLEAFDGLGTRCVAERILSAISMSFHIEGQEPHLGVSIGIAVVPRDGNDLNTSLHKVNTVMYLAKERGHNNFQAPASDLDDRVPHRLRTESGLRRVSDYNEFCVGYRPRVDMCSGRIVSTEALIRQNSVDFGHMMPGQFIQDTEGIGLVIETNYWTLRTTCDQPAC